MEDMLQTGDVVICDSVGGIEARDRWSHRGARCISSSSASTVIIVTTISGIRRLAVISIVVQQHV